MSSWFLYTNHCPLRLTSECADLSSPYDNSKTIVANVKENGEKTQGIGKTLSEGSPMLLMGFYPSRASLQPTPFGTRTP